MRIVLIFLVLLMGLVAVFAIQNPGIVTVSFFHYSGSTSILVVIVVSFGPGFWSGSFPASRPPSGGSAASGNLSRSLRPSGNRIPPPPTRLDRPKLSRQESKLLACLLLFYREIGPAATPAIRGLDEESGSRHELEEAVQGLRAKGLIEYWELKPAVRLTREGLRLGRRIGVEDG